MLPHGVHLYDTHTQVGDLDWLLYLRVQTVASSQLRQRVHGLNMLTCSGVQLPSHNIQICYHRWTL